jgi:hypothetical protein
MTAVGLGGGAIRVSVWVEDEFTGSSDDKRVARTRHRDDDYFEGRVMAANGHVEAGMEKGEAADRNTDLTKISERKLARELRE